MTTDRSRDASGNVGQRFDRLPDTEANRDTKGRATRSGVLDFFEDAYGIPPTTFEDHSFWEKGAGKIWVLAGRLASPGAIEALGMRILHTRQEHWKPTTNAVQRFGHAATRNVLELTPPEAARFVRGEDQPIDRWDGDWGYLIVARQLAGSAEPIGVGLYLNGELRSQIAKGRRRDLP
ncbi:MAG: hypothetical protein R3324_16325 [Halobacteriales archaeon]|nr:hypothetical protein [Halobacteriales archaeon]